MTCRIGGMMSINNHALRAGNRSAAVSEVIGSIFLISIVVAAVAIVGVFLFSQQTPQKVPDISFMTGTDNNNNLYLFHNGGDSLTIGQFFVLVDGIVKNNYVISGGGSQWSLGKTLIIAGVPSGSHSVQIVYNGTGTGAVLLRSAAANISLPSVPVAPDMPTATVTSSANYIFNDAINITNSSVFVTAIQQNLTRSSISFWKSTITSGKSTFTGLTCNGVCYNNSQKIFFFKFTVADTTGSSSITWGTTGSPNLIKLNNGDVVNISFNGGNVNYFTTFGIAPSIWEFTANPTTLNITFASNGTTVTTGSTAIIHTYILSYSNLASTLVIDVGNNVDTGLTVNGTQRINGLNSTDIMLTNVRPVPIGLYLISSAGGSGTTGLYFVGKADGIYYNNVLQTLL
jgi:FlaG/FlaF family flagellin (archaellin)